MNADKKDHVKGAISLILRLAIASLFIATAVSKFQMGTTQVVSFFQATFKGTWLPMWLVTLQARLIPWIEIAIPVWLLSGRRLQMAWFATALVLVSLGFGMAVAKNYSVASNNYFFVLMSCVGLYFSPYDCFKPGACCKSKESCE